jgi:hypothetical protein
MHSVVRSSDGSLSLPPRTSLHPLSHRLSNSSCLLNYLTSTIPPAQQLQLPSQLACARYPVGSAPPVAYSTTLRPLSRRLSNFSYLLNLLAPAIPPTQQLQLPSQLACARYPTGSATRLLSELPCARFSSYTARITSIKLSQWESVCKEPRTEVRGCEREATNESEPVG